MCWGMISWGIKGPFHVWDPESKPEKDKATAAIQQLNAATQQEEDRRIQEWKALPAYVELKTYELAEAGRVREEVKRRKIKAPKIIQTWRGKKFKINKITRGAHSAVDSWRYVNDVCRPILWPECKRRLALDPNFILMEDGTASHQSGYTICEREKEEIAKAPWPPNSPDFNPIERIWCLMKRRIQSRRGSEHITTVQEMKQVLREEWEKITVEEINIEIAKLPAIMERSIKQGGGNKFQA